MASVELDKRIMVACPLRDRSKILPYYLKHIYDLDYDRKKINLYFLLNNCKENVEDIVKQFQLDHLEEYESISYQTIDFSNPPQNNRSPIRRNDLYVNLTVLRNKIIERSICKQVDYLFSVDSDLLIPNDSLKRLLNHNVACVAGLIRNYTEDGFYNFLDYNVKNDCYERKPRRMKGLIEVGITGACFLVRSDVLKKCRYHVCLSGEDQGFAEDCRKYGFKQYVDVNLKIPHIFNIDEFIESGKGVI